MDVIAENDVVACSGIDGIPVSIDRRNNDSGFEKLGQIMAVNGESGLPPVLSE